MMLQRKREMGNGYSYMEANSFPHNLPTYLNIYIYIYIYYKGKDGLNIWEGFPKEELKEGERERERESLSKNF